MAPGAPDAAWTEQALADLTNEFGETYSGRTVLVTGADGFMGSHLTDALCHLGADVHAFVRATSSGALNNIGHLRRQLTVHFADLTDKTSIDYLIRALDGTKPYVFHLGAQAHVGESWHRPYETVMANTVGTLNLLQSIVDHGPRDREVRHRGHLGGVREPARVGRPPPRLRRAGQPDPPRALADQPEVGVRHREGGRRLPDDELLRRVRAARRGHPDVQQLRAPAEPALRHRDDHHPGARAAGDRARAARSAPRLLLLHRRRPRPPDRRRAGHSRATSTCTGRARTSRWATGAT